MKHFLFLLNQPDYYDIIFKNASSQSLKHEYFFFVSTYIYTNISFKSNSNPVFLHQQASYYSFYYVKMLEMKETQTEAALMNFKQSE